MAAAKKREAEEAVATLKRDRRRLWIRGILALVASAYLGTLWLDGVGSNLPAKMLPRPWVYFAQVAALFPYTSPVVIDYRAEGWSCSEHAWHEIDVRPWFPIDADTKENRFQRALQFYRTNRPVMQELEAYIVKHDPSKIGGVRFSSLRIPYPKPGEHVNETTRKPLSAYPKEQRKAWYWTPNSRRAERCGTRNEIDKSESETEE